MEYINAFWVGGLICVIGQLLIDLTKLTPARIMVMFVTVGVLLGALGIYGSIVDYAGCGATVPLCGFGWALSEGVREAVQEKGLLGAFTFCPVTNGLCVKNPRNTKVFLAVFALKPPALNKNTGISLVLKQTLGHLAKRLKKFNRRWGAGQRYLPCFFPPFLWPAYWINVKHTSGSSGLTCSSSPHSVASALAPVKFST